MTVAPGTVLWSPPADAWETSNVGAYARWLADEHGLQFRDHESLWRWSVDDLDRFWRSIWDYFDVHSSTPVGEVLARREMPGAIWFPGVRLNYAGELFRRAQGVEDTVAIVGVSQTRPDVQLTFGELLELIARVRAGLQRLGVGPGDRVVGYLPNVPETVAALFACASLGAVWASCAPEFGAQAVIDRFSQLDPTVLLAIDGYRYGAKDVDVTDRVAAIRSALPTLRHTVHLPYLGGDLPDTTSWAELTATSGPLDALDVPFDHPLYVLFSSGTTGLPKPIVHGHGGILLEHLKNHGFSWDLRPGDRLMWFSTTAWMMWNSQVSTLLFGASIVTIDGNPLYPDLEAQWRIAAATRATHLGLSPAFVMNCVKQGVEPTRSGDLGSLRMLAAAGSPLPVEGYVWLHEHFGDQAPLNVGSGGTDVCTGLVQGGPVVPVYAGEISGRCLGVDADAFDDDGRPVLGELGELVIRQPMPSMPVGFWGDPDMVRYRESYFEHFPGLMRFGDWIRFTEHGSCVITGRSDATLNRGGVRIGTAEIYRVVERHPRVADSLVIHLEDPEGGGGELVLFVVASSGEVDDELRSELAASIRSALSPRHVPDVVHGVRAVPYNLTGKKLELPVKKILRGAAPDSVVSRGAMADPDALDPYLDFVSARR